MPPLKTNGHSIWVDYCGPLFSDAAGSVDGFSFADIV
jgi:hypothetical protein